MNQASIPNIAIFIDYENVAIGASEAGIDRFPVDEILARLLERGKVLLKRAYCDWSRYAAARKPLHGAGFELVDVPPLSWSGKNSADIRMAVDAVDLCHSKAHLDLFVVVSGDSDFSPLVGKLRENAKEVLGFGMRGSSGRLLIDSCDEFEFIDDLVTAAPRVDQDDAVALVVRTAEAMIRDRGEPVWASHVKQVLKRKQPEFDERHAGYKSINDLVDSAAKRGLLNARRDSDSGGYLVQAVA